MGWKQRSTVGLILVLSGCASGPGGDVRNQSEDVRAAIAEEQARQEALADIDRGEEDERLFFGYTQAEEEQRTADLPDFFDQEVLFGRESDATMADLNDRVSSLFGFQIYIDPTAQEYLVGDAQARFDDDPQVDPEPIAGIPAEDYPIRLRHEGSLTNLFDRVGSRTNLHWRWDAADERVVFYRHAHRTFRLESFGGTFNMQSGMDSALGDEESSGGEDAVGFDSDEEDIWQSVLNAVRALASPDAVIRGAATPGRFAVRDTPLALERIAEFVDEVNHDLTRVILVDISVMEVEAREGEDQGIDLDFVWTDGEFSIDADSGLFSGAGSAAGIGAAVIDGSEFDGTSAFIQRLREYNHVNSVLRESVTTLNSMPVPVRRVTERGFVAETQATVTEGGSQVTASQDQRLEGASFIVQPRVISDSRIMVHFSARIAGELQLEEFSVGNVDEGGSTLQIPTQSSDEIVQQFAVRDGASMLVSSGSDRFGESGQRRNITGFADDASTRDRQTLIMITPRILN